MSFRAFHTSRGQELGRKSGRSAPWRVASSPRSADGSQRGAICENTLGTCSGICFNFQDNFQIQDKQVYRIFKHCTCHERLRLILKLPSINTEHTH